MITIRCSKCSKEIKSYNDLEDFDDLAKRCNYVNVGMFYYCKEHAPNLVIEKIKEEVKSKFTKIEKDENYQEMFKNK